MLKRLRIALKRMALDGSGRDKRQAPDEIVASLGLTAGDRVADLGSGTGYFTVRLARAVGPSGIVYAVDTDDELLDEVLGAAQASGIANVVPIVARRHEPGLPEPVDLIFLSHSYHHLAERPTYFARVALSLRPGGRVAVVEALPGTWLTRWWGHASDPETVRGEMAEAGYRLVAQHPGGKNESFQVFEVAINRRH